MPNLLNYSLEMFLLGPLETFDRTAEDTTLAAQAELNLADEVFNQTKTTQLDKQHFFPSRNREACVIYVLPQPPH